MSIFNRTLFDICYDLTYSKSISLLQLYKFKERTVVIYSAPESPERINAQWKILKTILIRLDYGAKLLRLYNSRCPPELTITI